jgi:hypothetical protein
MLKTSSVWCNLVVLKYYFGFFEIASSERIGGARMLAVVTLHPAYKAATTGCPLTAITMPAGRRSNGLKKSWMDGRMNPHPFSLSQWEREKG